MSERLGDWYELQRTARHKITLEKIEHVCNMNACSIF
ncbi:hypothetical protein AGR1A_Lc50067 [Agrobacterium fabacearum CFBP 5771]|nr:hypothetical protein AGR1A_Lc50067 [Agrobacterium fabacearum CFBP 5771]